MTAPRRAPLPSGALTAAIAAALVVLGFGAWGIYRLISGTEAHVYANGIAPTYVSVRAGRTYTLAVRGGVPAEQSVGVTPNTLRCTASVSATGRSILLTLTPEAADTKAINQIARFVSPVTGLVHVDCSGLGAIFVDDAQDAGTDWAGVSLLLALIALGVGLPLALSVLRRSAGRPRDEDEVEAVVEPTG